MRRRPMTEHDFIRAWNWYHPEAPRTLPPRVPREALPARLDALDVLLAVYILEARIGGA